MGKTRRITWLLQLLSLGFLFHGVCSVNSTDSPTSVSKNSDNVTPKAVAQNTVAPNMTTTIFVQDSSNNSTPSPGAVAPPTADAGKKSEPTQTPTSAQPAAVATAMTVRGPPRPDPTVLQVPTQTPVAPVKTAAPVTNADPTTVKDAATPKATPSLPRTTLPALGSGTSGPLVGATNAATVQPPVAATPGKTLGTKAPVVTSSDKTNVGTTQNAKVPTEAPPTTQRSTVDTTVTAKTGQEGSQGGSGTDKMTVTDRSREQAASGVTQPTGNMGPTSSPSTPAKAGPSATVGTFTAKAGPTLTTSTPNPASGHRIPSTSTAPAVATPSPTASKKFLYSLKKKHESAEKVLVKVCERLLENFEDGNCTLMWHSHNNETKFDSVEINGKVKTGLAKEHYNEISKTPTDSKTLIAILASCGALLIMIVILAVCASHHRKPYNENQQHLTEELHTVENGYHDNPTLEVMEVQPEMQEKKMAMNGEFNDSWIVPIDNLLKEDIPDEEDTHL